MTDTVTSQNIDLSSWDILYIYIYVRFVLGHIDMGYLWIVDQNWMKNIAYEIEARISCNKYLSNRFPTSQ
jgi:hypothetical protein